MRFEYKTVAAPTRGTRGNGVKGAQARFLNTLTTLLNEMGAEGWEYQGNDTLPFETRSALGKARTEEVDFLVFRRALPKQAPAERPTLGGTDHPAAPRLGSASKDIPAAPHNGPELAAE